MTKILTGIIVSLFVLNAYTLWRNSSLSEELGEFRQANQQLVAEIESLNDQLQKQVNTRNNESKISKQHHEETIRILRQEMDSRISLLQHKNTQLSKKLDQVKQQSLKQTLNRKKDVQHVVPVEECGNAPIPEFVLKQL